MTDLEKNILEVKASAFDVIQNEFESNDYEYSEIFFEGVFKATEATIKVLRGDVL